MPDGLDDGIDPKHFDGLWFEQVIQQNIKPQIENGQNVAVVISIPPAGLRAPHQLAKDGRYYRRRNFRNDIMEDSEIRDMLYRRRSPELFINISLPQEVVSLTWETAAQRSHPIALVMPLAGRHE